MAPGLHATRVLCRYMSYSLDSLKGDYLGGYIGDYYGVTKKDTRSLDYSSYEFRASGVGGRSGPQLACLSKFHPHTRSHSDTDLPKAVQGLHVGMLYVYICMCIYGNYFAHLERLCRYTGFTQGYYSNSGESDGKDDVQ